MKLFKKCNLTLSGFFCIIFLTATTQQKQNFSGNWALNTKQSDFGSLDPDSAPKQIIAQQSPDSIVITKTFEHQGKVPNTYAQSFYFDGKASVRIAGGKEKRVSLIALSRDTLVFNTRSYVDNQEFKWEYTTTEWWCLSEDSKYLIIRRKAVFPDRTELYKAQYERR